MSISRYPTDREFDLLKHVDERVKEIIDEGKPVPLKIYVCPKLYDECVKLEDITELSIITNSGTVIIEPHPMGESSVYKIIRDLF